MSADRVSPEVRSQTMAAIRGRGTSIEVTFEDLVRKTRYSFVTHPRWLGSPDIAFPRRGVVVFLDSCFWHHCPAHFRPPRSRTEYWEAKIARNVSRDLDVNRTYRARGWLVLRFWEHALTSDPVVCLRLLVLSLRRRPRLQFSPPPAIRTKGGGVPFR